MPALPSLPTPALGVVLAAVLAGSEEEQASEEEAAVASEGRLLPVVKARVLEEDVEETLVTQRMLVALVVVPGHGVGVGGQAIGLWRGQVTVSRRRRRASRRAGCCASSPTCTWIPNAGYAR